MSVGTALRSVCSATVTEFRRRTMKKYKILGLFVGLALLVPFAPKWAEPQSFALSSSRSAVAEPSAIWTATSADALTENEDGSYIFAPGAAFHYGKDVDLAGEGVSMRFGIEGTFSRQDTWFALLIQSQNGDEIGAYRGFNYQFKPVSNQAVSDGSLSAYQSVYGIGLREGGTTPKYINTIKTTEIETRETPTVFNFSIFQTDGTFIVSFGQDTFTYPMNLPEIALTKMKVSFIFGGNDALDSNMRIRLYNFGSALEGGFFHHASESYPMEEGGVRIVENTKRQGKIMYPVSLNSGKDISVKFKINQAPGYFIGDNIDAWFGIMLTSSPNSALPGSATVGVILQAHADAGLGRKVIGGQFFKLGAFAGGFSVGVTTKAEDEYDELRISFRDDKILFELEGTTISRGEISADGVSFPDGKAYLSFGFHDNQPASNIEYNEYHEEIGREPNPNVKYWDVIIADISETGTPTVSTDKKYNIYGGEKATVPVRLYGSTFARLLVQKEDEYVNLPAGALGIQQKGDILYLNFSHEYAKSILNEPTVFRLVTESVNPLYNNVNTDFTATMVEADVAVPKTTRGTFDPTLYNDVKVSFDIRDDELVSVTGTGINRSNYFFNPLTGNLYIKREYLKTLSAGTYEFNVNFEFSSHTVVVETLEAPKDEKSGCNGCDKGSSASILALTAAGAVLLGVKGFFH